MKVPFAIDASVLEGWATAALAVIGVVSLLATALTIFFSWRDSKRARTFEYMRRLYGLEFSPLNTRVLCFLASGDRKVLLNRHPAIPKASEAADEEARKEVFEKLDLTSRADVILVLNFYEELGGSYRKKLLDRGIADSALIPQAVHAWEAAEWLIKSLRHDGADPKIAYEWEALVKNVKPPKTRWVRLRKCKPTLPALLLGAAAALILAGLAVGLASAAEHHVPGIGQSFLVAAGAGCLVLAIVALGRLLIESTTLMKLAAIATLTVTATATATVGWTVKLHLDASEGPTGPRGPTGTTGTMGAKGSPGRTGPTGKRGATGARGASGSTGRQGPRGQKGRQGPTGPRGPRGYPGAWDPS